MDEEQVARLLEDARAEGRAEGRAELEAAQQTITQQQKTINATAQLAAKAVLDAISVLEAGGKWSVSLPLAREVARLRGVVRQLNAIAEAARPLVAQAGPQDVRQEDHPWRASAAAAVHRGRRNPNPSQMDSGGAHSGAAVDRLGRDAWDAVTCPRLRANAIGLYTKIGCIKAMQAMHAVA